MRFLWLWPGTMAGSGGLSLPSHNDRPSSGDTRIERTECSHVSAAHLNGNAECRTLITSDAALRPGPGLVVASLHWAVQCS